MFVKVCAISVALSFLGVSLFDRKVEGAKDCKAGESHCPPVQAIASGIHHMYAALMAR